MDGRTQIVTPGAPDGAKNMLMFLIATEEELVMTTRFYFESLFSELLNT